MTNLEYIIKQSQDIERLILEAMEYADTYEDASYLDNIYNAVCEITKKCEQIMLDDV